METRFLEKRTDAWEAQQLKMGSQDNLSGVEYTR